MREKRFTLRALLLSVLASLLAALLLILGVLYALVGKEGLGMAEALVLINSRFVGEHDITQATDQAMDGLIEGLGDRWSYYMDAEGYARQKENRENAYVGIGATVQYPEGDGLTVVSVVEGGPADQAGLTAGETILAVDGVALTGEDKSRGPELTKGPEGSQVLLRVLGTDGTEREVTVVRGRVEEHPVAYELLADGTGLVTIKNFHNRCASETKAAVEDLVDQGAERLVFDVRNNGGGFLSELTDLLDYLLPQGTIFRSRDKGGREEAVESDVQCVELPMAVLVNGGTYSAAEFFAAQIQEMGWGIIVGEPTFGKGYSQQTFALPTGGAINISTAEYFTGEGVSLIGTGLTLDKELALTEDQAAALRAGALEPAEDPQVQAAIALLREWTHWPA